MSDLLNQASLVMVPSGYKEDTVYSVVPSDGSGDLSFTRASNGTRVNSAGLVEVCPWNLVQNSENFSAVWTAYQSTITSNTATAPNGTLTADSITDNSGNDVHIAYQTMAGIVAGTYTISLYAKASTLSHINLQWYDGTTFYTSNAFNLSNGTTTGANQSIESVGNGWYRCIFTFTTTVSGTQYAYVLLNNGTSNFYTGTGTGTVFIWGAQVNIGSTAKPYFPTTDRLNVPRLTYQNGGGGCPSLLLEKQSTNLMLYSEQFDNAVYTKRNSTISANATTSPDGTTNADKIQEDTSNARHDIYQNFTCTNGVTYTQTIFAKQGERRYCFMSFGTALINAGDSYFDLQDGVVVSSPSGLTSTIENMGNGWFRCRITATCSGDGTGYYVNGPAITSSNYIYQGVSGYGIYVWGCQIEASSYATSLINTTSATATRVADACSKTGISSLIGQTEGVLFIDLIASSYNADGASYSLLATLGNSSENFQIYTNNALLRCYISASGTEDVSTGITLVNGNRYKIALAYKSGDSVVFVNGALTNTMAKTTMPTAADFYLNQYSDGSLKSSNSFNQAILFKTRLSNSDLIALTTI
jgi:hypothetical protein